MPKVVRSTIIDVPVERLWAVVRDFNAHDQYHPIVATSLIERGYPVDKVGCVRRFTLQDGNELREQLLGLSDFDMFCTYSILDSPMPLTNYVATLRLTPITDQDRTFIEWSADFDCTPDKEGELLSNIGGGVFQGGFDALKRAFGG